MTRAAFTVLLFCFVAISAAETRADDFADLAAPFLKKHCLACHGPEKQEANLRYDRLTGYETKQRNLWTMMHERIAAGEMPPDGEPRPDAAETKQVLDWIRAEQRALAPTGTRRLNRRELSAALQDLTGLSVNYAWSLPGDGKVAGFDTGANALQDAESSVARMMQVTRRAVDAIRFLEPARGKTFSADLVDTKDARRGLDAWKEDGAKPKVRGFGVPGVGLLVEPTWVGERGGTSVKVPIPAGGRGVLRVTLIVAAKKYWPELPNPHLWLEVGHRKVDYREIASAEPQQLVYEIQLEDVAVEGDGVSIEIAGRIEVPYAIEGFENEDKTKPEDKLPGAARTYRPVYNKKAKPEDQPVPFVVLRRIVVETDFVAAWPPRNDANLETADNNQSADQLLSLWIEQAWRRPAKRDEKQRFADLYLELRGRGMNFDDALRATFQAVLLSGPFRYLPTPGHSDETVAQHAIAARVSFMLTGGPPDAELRQLAGAGRLRDADVLSGQVDRLLTSSAADGFVRPFVTQWLEMDQPITHAMERFSLQDFRFGRFLKSSMREETIGYVARLFAENRTASEIIRSDWTMMNNSLAWHYGYDGVEGGHLRPVKLRKNDPRGGGILGHAGIQSMLCWMGDNWVIYRGAWALRHILDDPPPPPPLEVPELDPSAGENRGKSFRELLKQHQEDSRCSVCHKAMDPLGFAFQNFDLSGRWRDVEFERYVRDELDGKVAWYGAGPTRPVDAVGQLPRGEQFSDFAGCKQQLVEHYLPDVVRGIMKKLMLYATSRQPDIDDMSEIRSSMKALASKGYPMRDMVKSVLRSKGFLQR